MTRETFYSYKKDLAKKRLRDVIDKYQNEPDQTLDKNQVIHDLEKLYTDLFIRG